MESNISERELYILYGSQTGTCEDLALRLSRYINQKYLNVKTIPLNDFDICKLLDNITILFIVATTGDGDPPDNMLQFWKCIMHRKVKLSLNQLTFGVIGLGDSSYQHYNSIAKKLFKRLTQLKGKYLIPLVLGDDQYELGSDAQINPWLTKFWDELKDLYNLPPEFLDINRSSPFPSMYSVEICDQDIFDLKNVEEFEKKIADGCPEYKAIVEENIRVTPDSHFQEVRHFKFQIKDQFLQFSPGDIALVRPKNLSENVEEFLKIFKTCDHHKVLTISSSDPEIKLPPHLPSKCSIEYLATHYWDLSTVPRRSFFELFHHFSQSELEKEKIQEFCFSQELEDFYNYTSRPRRSILEVLQDFPNTTPHVPLNYWLDLMPVIKPRSFSIASSCILQPNKLDLLVAIVKYQTRLKKPRLGLCSNWLSRLKVDTQVYMAIKKGTFVIPKGNIPVIMVGPGTGCAPFRSVIQNRVCNNIGNNYLFFGCRNKEADHYFYEEWKGYIEKGLLSYFVAFSRDQPHKIYVQDKIKEQRTLIGQLLEEGAHFLIAGNSGTMSQDVRAVLSNIIENELGKTADETASYIRTLENERRLQCEIW